MQKTFAVGWRRTNMRSFENSKKAFAEAIDLMPGGVNSPVRAFKSVNMNPIFVEKGKGAIVTDIDGNEYIDYILSWGPLILGHAHDEVVAAIAEQAAKGASFGAPTLSENKLAKLVMGRMPAMEMIRLFLLVRRRQCLHFVWRVDLQVAIKF